jgi:hypothetical protein
LIRSAAEAWRPLSPARPPAPARMEIDSDPAGFDAASFRPEPLSLTADGPGTFTFDNLQSIQDISAPTPTMKSETTVGTHAAYEDALLEYSGLNEQDHESFQFNLTPGHSPMKFKADPQPVDQYAQQPQGHGAQQQLVGGQSLAADSSLPVAAGPGEQPHLQPAGQQGHAEFSVAGFQQNAAQPLASMPIQPTDAPQKGGRSPADDEDDGMDNGVPRTYTLGREDAVALLNTPGGVTTEDELNEIDPGLLTPEETKKLKRMRRAIRNRESATASRMRRKEYIESLEKRTSELCSENAMLDLSVAEMKMREKAKAEELERVRQENNQLRAESYANRAENHQLRQDKQAIEERLKNVKLVDESEAEALDRTSGPGTWPLPKKRPQRFKMGQQGMMGMGLAGMSISSGGNSPSPRSGQEPLSPAARVAQAAAEQAAAAHAAAQQAQAAAAQAQAQAQAAAAHAAAQAQQAAAAQQAAVAQDGGYHLDLNTASHFSSYLQR